MLIIRDPECRLIAISVKKPQDYRCFTGGVDYILTSTLYKRFSYQTQVNKSGVSNVESLETLIKDVPRMNIYQAEPYGEFANMFWDGFAVFLRKHGNYMQSDVHPFWWHHLRTHIMFCNESLKGQDAILTRIEAQDRSVGICSGSETLHLMQMLSLPGNPDKAMVIYKILFVDRKNQRVRLGSERIIFCEEWLSYLLPYLHLEKNDWLRTKFDNAEIPYKSYQNTNLKELSKKKGKLTEKRIKRTIQLLASQSMLQTIYMGNENDLIFKKKYSHEKKIMDSFNSQQETILQDKSNTFYLLDSSYDNLFSIPFPLPLQQLITDYFTREEDFEGNDSAWVEQRGFTPDTQWKKAHELELNIFKQYLKNQEK